MELQDAVNSVFIQLSGTLEQLSDEQYAQPSSHLLNNAIGQHVRHIIELFQCLELGYDINNNNYEKRKRDKLIETNKQLATQLLVTIHARLDRPDKPLLLEANYDELDSRTVTITTNYYRELAYNLEHTIHHMALIRIGLNEISSIRIPENFGVASATIQYRKKCAQ